MGENEKLPFQQITLGAYKQLIRLFLRYVLIRCAIYTNTRKEAELITYCAFKEVWQSLSQFDSIGQAGQALHSTIDSMGEQCAQARIQTEDTRRLTKTEMLVADNKIQQLVHKINTLGDIPQQILILNHIEMLSLKEISIIYKKPIKDVMSIMTTAENTLADKLTVLWKPDTIAADDICLWMDKIDTALGKDLRECIAGAILSDLAKPGIHESDGHSNRNKA